MIIPMTILQYSDACTKLRLTFQNIFSCFVLGKYAVNRLQASKLVDESKWAWTSDGLTTTTELRYFGVIFWESHIVKVVSYIMIYTLWLCIPYARYQLYMSLYLGPSFSVVAVIVIKLCLAKLYPRVLCLALSFCSAVTPQTIGFISSN